MEKIVIHLDMLTDFFSERLQHHLMNDVRPPRAGWAALFCLLLPISACTEVRTVPVEMERAAPAVIRSAFETVAIPLPEPHFWMGNEADMDERPRHLVSLTIPFESMKSEVTQRLYTLLTGQNPSFFQKCGGDCPVEKVRWIEAIHFANELSTSLGFQPCYTVGVRGHVEWDQTCTGWRLPTEAEWEWMASGGLDHNHMLNQIAWFHENSKGHTHPVCTKEANDFGLCDVLGNVQEWVWDRSAEYVDRDPEQSEVDPTGGSLGSHRVFRGGSWNRYGENLTPQVRKDGSIYFRNNDLGFRLVRTVLVVGDQKDETGEQIEEDAPIPSDDASSETTSEQELQDVKTGAE